MPDAGSPISIPTKLLATGVACALAIVVCGTAASVVVASDATGKLKKTSDARREVALEYRDNKSFRDVGANAARLDSLLAPLGHLAPAQSLDIAIINRLNTRKNQPLSPAWESSPLAPSPGELPEGGRKFGLFKSRVDSTLSAAWYESAARDTTSPWLPVFRRWARTTPLPPLWGYRPGLPGVVDARDMPLRSFSAFRKVFQVNTDAGVLALRDHQYAIAMERARENIAASRHFLEQPLLFDAMLGRVELRAGLGLLTVAARSAGDTATLRIAALLDSAAAQFSFGPRQLMAELADPSSRAAEQVIADRDVLPAFRLEAFDAVIRGGCRNNREIVFGFDERRRESLNRAIGLVSDIPRGAELAQQYAKFLDYAMSDAHSEREPIKDSLLDRSELLKLFSWIVPPGVRARATLCLEQG